MMATKAKGKAAAAVEVGGRCGARCGVEGMEGGGGCGKVVVDGRGAERRGWAGDDDDDGAGDGSSGRNDDGCDDGGDW